ncbi:MAG TPA: hypothetical protein VFL28_02570 [bacterium]|nr:hypothetical protein [bacterium]
MRTCVALVAVFALAFSLVPAFAGSILTAPAGTKVLLRFETPVDSGKIAEGAQVRFTVATDVLIYRTAVVTQGTPAQGIVTDVSKPGIFGKNARVHIAYVEVNAVDGRPVRLAPLDVTPDSVRQVSDVGAAGATSLTGAIILGPVGLAAGALIHGGNVSLPAGAVGTSSLEQDLQIAAP